MKKTTLTSIIGLAGAVLFSSSAFAAGYGEAGCGLGSLIFGDTKGPIQILAATTNGTFYSQTFGITSGTSNCDAKGFDTTQRDQERFVANNFSGLAKEMATGEGENLTVLAGIMGCPSVSQARFNSVTRENYPAIFSSDSTGPAEMLSGVKTAVLNDAELSSACSLN